MPAPRTAIEWSRLSPRSMEIVRQVGIRLSAGYDFEEVAVMLEQHRDDLRHNELPEGAITPAWCKARLREVRLEVARTRADAPD